MTCSHWLVTQSVTSYISLQDIEPGVSLVFSRLGEHTFWYQQYSELQVAAPAVRDLQ